jgi:hypothetical protein
MPAAIDHVVGLWRAGSGHVGALDATPASFLSIAQSDVSTDVNNEQSGVRWYWQVLVLCAAAALIISRQPQAFFHAQFYGEDGHVWFADAYNRGWLTPLFRTQDGYFQTLPRLAAALALVWPLAFAPLVMNIVGLTVQILPVPVLLSGRLSNWGSLRFRGVLAVVYLVMPNCSELNVTVTEAQWHLALVACLLVLAEVPGSAAGRLFDVAILVLCGLTGPFCILLLPVAVMFLALRKDARRWVSVAILSCALAIQIHALLFIDSARHLSFPLGASMEGFARILAGQVYLGTVLGSNMLGTTAGAPFLVAIAIAGTLIACYVLFRTGREFRLFLLFSSFILAAALANPKTGPQYSYTTAWQVLAAMPAAHYWFFPTLASWWGVTWLLSGSRRSQLSQAIGTLLIPVMLVGVIRDWRHPAHEDLKFAKYANKVMASKPGEAIVIPETPAGWTLRLVKK